jgi:exosortase D (VPLPA-CTERM-specific)
MNSVQTMKSSRHSDVCIGLLVVTAIAIALLAFAGALRELVHRWDTQEEYSHGFLIPFISAWLLWARRDALRANLGQPSWLGLVAVILAFGMHIVGELSAIFILSQVGFVITLIGIVLGIGGLPLLRVTFIPIAFLLFAIPLPYFIDAELTLRLQLISSELGVFFIRMFGIPVYLDGNIIDMGNYKLQVVEACSGLRYLYPLLSLSFLAAYLFHAPLWQRILVFLSSIPIAIGMNGFRIGVVGFLVDRWGTQMAEGALHFFEGWVIFVACAALLAAEMYALSLMSGKRFLDQFYFPSLQTALPTNSSNVPRLRSQSPLVASFLLMCAGAVAIYVITGRSEITPERARFVEFPQLIGQWKGQVGSLDLATEKALRVDDYILADYTQSDGRPVNLYVAYYASQRKGESPHSPVVCIPGGGWAITGLQEIDYPNAADNWPINRVVIQKGDIKQVVYYWFDERGRKIANEYWAKFYLLTDSIVKNRTDGALVRLTTQVFRGESEQDADQRLKAFMLGALPKLAQFLPTASPAQPRSASAPAPGQS